MRRTLDGYALDRVLLQKCLSAWTWIVGRLQDAGAIKADLEVDHRGRGRHVGRTDDRIVKPLCRNRRHGGQRLGDGLLRDRGRVTEEKAQVVRRSIIRSHIQLILIQHARVRIHHIASSRGIRHRKDNVSPG